MNTLLKPITCAASVALLSLMGGNAIGNPEMSTNELTKPADKVSQADSKPALEKTEASALEILPKGKRLSGENPLGLEDSHEFLEDFVD